MLILLLAAAVLLLAGAITSFYRRRWHRALDVSIRFSPETMPEGGFGTLTETVANRKLIPFWCGNIQFAFPSFLSLSDRENPGNQAVKDAISAASYQRTVQTLSFTARKRGYFALDTAELITKDPFFRYRMLARRRVQTEVYVYPDPALLRGAILQLSQLEGDMLARRFFPEDPEQFRGIREYRPSDSARRINWAATAKTGGLMVNEADSSTYRKAALLLDFDTDTAWTDSDLKEDILRAAARLCQTFLKNGMAVSIQTNAKDAKSGTEASLTARSGAGQYEAAMRLLARVLPDACTRPFPSLLEEAMRGSSGSPAQFVLISFSAPKELQRRTHPLRDAGMRWLIFCKRDEVPFLSDRTGIFLCEVD